MLRQSWQGELCGVLWRRGQGELCGVLLWWRGELSDDLQSHPEGELHLVWFPGQN